MGERGAVVGPVALERLDDRPHGERQVRAGVAVGHRVDVEVVDPAPARPRSRPARRAPLEHARSHAVSSDVLDEDLDRLDRQAGQPLDVVGDLRAHGRGDLGEVEAVLDDDAQPDPQAGGVAADGDPVAPSSLPTREPRRQPDDAVAARGGLGDELRDDVAGDRDRAARETTVRVGHGAS